MDKYVFFYVTKVLMTSSILDDGLQLSNNSNLLTL